MALWNKIKTIFRGFCNKNTGDRVTELGSGVGESSSASDCSAGSCDAEGDNLENARDISDFTDGFASQAVDNGGYRDAGKEAREKLADIIKKKKEVGNDQRGKFVNNRVAQLIKLECRRR